MMISTLSTIISFYGTLCENPHVTFSLNLRNLDPFFHIVICIIAANMSMNCTSMPRIIKLLITQKNKDLITVSTKKTVYNKEALEALKNILIVFYFDFFLRKLFIKLLFLLFLLAFTLAFLYFIIPIFTIFTYILLVL